MAEGAQLAARVSGGALFLVGLGSAAFGLHVGVNGAEPPLPAAAESVEGELEDGPLTRAPVGEPFLYGEVRVADQPGRNAPHHRGNYGDPQQRVRLPSGESVSVRLDQPAEWRLDTMEREDQREVMSLAGLPLVGDVDTERRLNPPFHLRVRALRPGDPLLLEVRDGVVLRTYVGDRATHEALHAGRESMRWPMVVLLLVLGIVSVFGGVRLLRARPEPLEPEPVE